MKVWRNSEGREFHPDDTGWCTEYGATLCPELMGALGYELVEKEEPEDEFEVVCRLRGDFDDEVLQDDRLIPGELYSVRKVKR